MVIIRFPNGSDWYKPTGHFGDSLKILLPGTQTKVILRQRWSVLKY